MNGKPNGTVGTCDAPWISKQSRFSICFSFSSDFAVSLWGGWVAWRERKVKWKVNFHTKRRDFHHFFKVSTSEWCESEAGNKTLWLFVFLLPAHRGAAIVFEIISKRLGSRVEIIISPRRLFFAVYGRRSERARALRESERQFSKVVTLETPPYETQFVTSWHIESMRPSPRCRPIWCAMKVN